MGGKGAILLVLGFSAIFLFFGHNFNSISLTSVEDHVEYFTNAHAHNLAVTGANISLNEIFLDKDWSAGFVDLASEGGLINVTVSDSVDDTKIIRSVGTYKGESRRVLVKLQPSGFAKFAWYIGNINSKKFITGDTIWGPFHTQSKLNIGGDPVFWGKVTTLKGLSPNAQQLAMNGYEPKFYGGFESGVDIPLTVNYEFDEQKNAALDGVNNYGGSSYFGDTDLWLTFNSDGTITYRTGSGSDSSSYNAPVTLPLTTFAPTGVIYVNKGNIYMSGTVNGNITVVAGESSGSGHGNVYFADDVIYRNPPMQWDAGSSTYVTNSSVTDMLGILATNNVIVMDNEKNVNNKHIVVHASIFCSQGGLTLENENIPPSGSFYLMGGLIAAKEELLAKTDAYGLIKNGYKKHVVFDQRMLLANPPYFPKTGNLEIVTWLE